MLDGVQAMQRVMSQIPLKRLLALALAFLTAVVLSGGMVYVVLKAANVAEPAATTVYGLTEKRLWATIAAGLAVVSVVSGGLALARPVVRFRITAGRLGAIAVVAGIIAVVNGWLVLATADGGPNSGNGVVGAAGALVLGVAGVIIGGLALARSRRANLAK